MVSGTISAKFSDYQSPKAVAPEPQHQGKRPKSRNDKDGVKWPFYLDIRKHLRKGRPLSACNTSLFATREPYRGSDLEAYVETINISCLDTCRNY